MIGCTSLICNLVSVCFMLGTYPGDPKYSDVRVHLIYKAIAHDSHYLLDIWLLHECISRAGALGAQKAIAAIDIPIP
jgi:hypothetical protein